MKELQDYYSQVQSEVGWDDADSSNYKDSKSFLLLNHLLLTTEVAEVAEEFRQLFVKTDQKIEIGMEPDEAFHLSKNEIRENLGKELADCLAYLLKLSNFFDFDLEKEFYSKMEEKRTILLEVKES